MRRHAVGLIVTLTLSILAASLVANAQPPGKKIPRIGSLDDSSPAVNPQRREAFSQGLRDLGWVEGQNVAIEYRYAEGQDERLPELAADLVRLQVDVIVARNAPAVRAAKHATRTIPIVMATGGQDPVEAGFVASLAHLGGNVTGLSMGVGDQFAGKWVELLKEVVPLAPRVLVLWDPTRPAMRAILAETERTARSLGVQLSFLEVRAPHEFAQAFAAIPHEGADALIVLPSALFGRERHPIVEFVATRRLPAMFYVRDFVDAGGLMSYGPNGQAMQRRAAYYVDRLLKGTQPAALPVEEPLQYELVVNLKTANALGLKLPPTLLIGANEVIQ